MFTRTAMLLSALAIATSCKPAAESPHTAANLALTRVNGVALELRDTTVMALLEASGVAEAVQQATLSTKLMGTVIDVAVHEGDIVTTGHVLVSIDARDVTAKASQTAAAISSAEAMQKEAAAQVSRFRALYADSAATKAQLEGAETGLARADAALRVARASASEVDAMSSYATIRAPFNGVITARMADPGTFAAPGVALLTVQDVSTLRIRASIAADAARHLARGRRIAASIDGDSVNAVVEAIVPTATANLFTINATVDNRVRVGTTAHRAGSAAILFIPTDSVRALMVPRSAIVHEGDLTGVIVRGATRDERRWVRVGRSVGALVEIASGVQRGETVIVPATTKPDGR
ncbi:MAG: efflux RND transporter periplasmic adaptor subunit [Gemmatimonadaceae bacterium]